MVDLLERDALLRDENDDEGRLKRFLGLPDSVTASTGASVVEAAVLGFRLKRLRPAVKLPRPRGASVEGAAVVVVVVVVGACVVVVVVVVVARVDGTAFSVSLSRVVASSSLASVVASDFLLSSLAFSFARIAYKSMANFSMSGVVSSSLSSVDLTVVLEAYSTDDLETDSSSSDFDSSVSMILGPAFEFLSFSSVTKLWLSTSSRLGRFTCCFLPGAAVSGSASADEADLARCGKRVTCGRRSSTYKKCRKSIVN